MTSLPTLRRKILKSFALFIGLYAFLGFLLLVSVKISSKTTPTLIHLNYDSVSAASRMIHAWNALQYPDYASRQSSDYWIKQFEDALSFEEKNITELGEKEVALSIRQEWENARREASGFSVKRGEFVRKQLDQLVVVNEKGMFALAQGNERLGTRVLIGSIAYFLLSLILSVLFADNLAQRLSRPLKSIAEALHRRPGVNRRLKLPEATTLEVLVLTSELERLWERLGQNDRVNVSEILQQKTKLEVLLGSVEDGLLVLDQAGKVSHCNGRFCELIGLASDQVVGQSWMDLSTLNSNYLKLRTALREGMTEGESLDLNWNESTRYFSARSRAIESSNKEVSGNLYLIHDITEKKLRDKFRAEFIDLLSHELKTPLQSLGTASELLSTQKNNFSEDTQILIDTVAEDVERIRAVAQEFVQVTQSHAKILKLKMDLVALNQLLPEWIKPFTVIAKDRGVKLTFQQEGSEVIWANLDLVKFPWVVSNLLSNAVRFSPKGSAVGVFLTDRSGFVEIQIKDEGPGIAEGEQGRIFEPFYQGPSGISSGNRGLFGIGLTIAKEVVEAHDGRIEYHSVSPRGSQFRVLLPFPPIKYGGEGNLESPETKSWTH